MAESTVFRKSEMKQDKAKSGAAVILSVRRDVHREIAESECELMKWPLASKNR